MGVKLNPIKLCDVEDEPVEWLIHEILMKKATILLGGSGSAGKSSLAVYWAEELAKRNTKSLFLVNEARMASYKDKVTDKTISNIELQKICPIDEDDEVDTKGVDEYMKGNNISLIVIDPITDMFEGELNSLMDVRRAMKPWIRIAHKYGCTVLLIHHFNKKSSKLDIPIEDRFTGSRAWVDAQRMAWALDYNKKTKERILQLVKCNELEEGTSYRVNTESLAPKYGMRVTSIEYIGSNVLEEPDNKIPPSLFLQLARQLGHKPFTKKEVIAIGVAPSTFDYQKKHNGDRWLLKCPNGTPQNKGRQEEHYCLDERVFQFLP